MVDRRKLMQTIGGLGIASALGVGSTGTALADDNGGNGNGNGDDGSSGNGSASRTGSGYTPYGGRTTKTPSELGTFDHNLMYLAEGVIDGPTESPHADPKSEHYDTGGVEGDPLLAKFWHFDIQMRTVEEIIADRQAHHDFMLRHYGIDMQASAYGEAYSVSPGTLAPPLGQRGNKAVWAFPDEGPDEFTGEPVTDGITEENLFDTFVWRPDPYGNVTDAVVPETSLMLEPKVAYTNYLKSGVSVPANDEADSPLGGMTNRDTFTTNKVRDGGYWIFAVEDDDIPRWFIRDSLEDAGEDPPQFWYNVQADGELRMGRGVKGGKEPDASPPDKLFLDGVGPDAEFHEGLPEEMGTFWGHYNINRGENQPPLSIHYRSGFPTEFNPHSGIPRAFMCELQCAEFATERNPKGLGRVHGSTYPTGTTMNGNTNGHNFRNHGAPAGMPTSTIRNVLTFPPSLTRGRASDPSGERQYNIAPGWPEEMPDSQFDIPGYPAALKEELM
jgi:hypothetical protein